MDLDQLESKLKQISSSTPTAQNTVSTSSTANNKPVSVTKKVNTGSNNKFKTIDSAKIASSVLTNHF